MVDGMLNERLILGDACVAEGAAWLAAHDRRFAEALEITGPLPLRLREGGFHQLLAAIVSQQLSVSAAAARCRRARPRRTGRRSSLCPPPADRQCTPQRDT